jgi:hypothetical protein
MHSSNSFKHLDFFAEINLKLIIFLLVFLFLSIIFFKYLYMHVYALINMLANALVFCQINNILINITFRLEFG